MRGLVPKFIMLICLLHINFRPFDPCERVLTKLMCLALFQNHVVFCFTTGHLLRGLIMEGQHYIVSVQYGGTFSNEREIFGFCLPQMTFQGQNFRRDLPKNARQDFRITPYIYYAYSSLFN